MAAVICLVANFFLLKSMMNEFEYKRRIMPEISIGIGQFMFIFEFISFIAIVVNCAIAYFTSERYKELVVSGENSLGLDMATFLIIVVSVEHALVIIKKGISMFIGDESQKYMERLRINGILKRQHEADERTTMERRRKAGDPDSEDIWQRVNDIVVEKKEEKVEEDKANKDRIDYKKHHTDIKHIH